MNILSKIRDIGLSGDHDETWNKSVQLVNSTSVVFAFAMLGWMLIALIYKPYLNLNLILFCISLVTCVICVYLNYRHRLKWAIWLFLLSYGICMAGHVIICGNQYNHHLLLVPGIFFAFFFQIHKSRTLQGIVALYVLSFFYFEFVFPDSEQLVVLDRKTALMMKHAVNTTLWFAISFVAFFVAVTIRNAEANILLERRRAENLLYNILPKPIALRLGKTSGVIADSHTSVSILFADLVGFTRYANGKTPEQVVDVLDTIFSKFDHLAEQYRLEKIKTIGDSYMVPSGIPDPDKDHAIKITEFALSISNYFMELNTTDKIPFKLRIGINSGPVVAGVIGKRKFSYDLWGDSVNMASRMESHGLPGEIQITEQTYSLIKDHFKIELRGPMEIKGKGTMKTYLVKSRIPEF